MWTVDKIKFILNHAADFTLVNSKRIRNSFIIYRFLQRMFQRQTADEQAYKSTSKDNGVGFTGADAPILSDIAVSSLAYMRKTPNANGLTAFWGVYNDDSKYAKLISPKFNEQREADQWMTMNSQRGLFADGAVVKVGGQAPFVARRLMKYANTQLIAIAEQFADAAGGEQTCEPEGYVPPAPKTRKPRTKKVLVVADTITQQEIAAVAFALSETYNDSVNGERGTYPTPNSPDLTTFTDKVLPAVSDAPRVANHEIESPQYEIESLVQELKENNPEAYYSDGDMDDETAHAFWSNRFKNDRRPVGGR